MSTHPVIVVVSLLVFSSFQLLSHRSYGQTSPSSTSEKQSKSNAGQGLAEQDRDEAKKAKVRERDAIDKRFQQLVAEGKIDEAIPLGEQWLALERSISGNESPSIDGKLAEIASMLEDAERWDAATEKYKEFRQRIAARYGNDYWQAIDARLSIERIKLLRSLSESQVTELHKADSFYLLSKSEYEKGDYSNAATHASQNLEIRKRIFGDQHPDYATSLSNLAVRYHSIGENAKAEPLMREVLTIRSVALGVKHPAYATSLNNLAMLYKATGDHAKAEPLFMESIEIKKVALGEKHPSYADSINNLALLYEVMGEYEKAVPLQMESLAIRKEILGERHPNYADSLNNLASLYLNMGDHAKAVPLMKASLSITKIALGEQHPSYAISLNNLAMLYEAMGDYINSEPLQIKSLAILRDSLGVQHPDYAAGLNNLAMLYDAMDDDVKAVPLYLESMEILKASLGEHHPTYGHCLGRLAKVYLDMGENAKAETLMKDSLAITKHALGEQNPFYAVRLNDLGLLYQKIGDMVRAESAFKESLSIGNATMGEFHPDQAAILKNLANMYGSMKDNVRAEALYEKCLSITKKHLEDTAYALSERQQLAMNQSVRYQLDAYLRFCLASNKIPSKAVENVMLWKGSVLVRLRGIRIGMNDPTISNQFAELQRAAAQLSKLAQTLPDTKDSDNWKTKVAKLTADKEELEANLMRSSATFRDAMEQVSFAQIRQAIPEDAVLVDYLEFAGKEGRALLASVVKRDGEPVLIPLGSANEASEAIDAWRETFGMSAQGKAAGLKLRQQIWEPLLQHIGSSKTILVSTDGVLGRLPIAALPGKELGSYLIEDHRIALIPVPQLLPALVNEKGRKKLKRELMLMGDVNYDAEPNQDGIEVKGATPPRKRPGERSEVPTEVRGDIRWNALSETRAEVEYIAGLYKRLFQPTADGVIDLRQSAASETAFRTYAPESEYLHLATHGFFAAPNAKSALSAELAAQRGKNRDAMFGKEREILRGHSPGQLSGIVFAGANRKPTAIDPLSNEEQSDDGIMTADEIAFLQLKGVRLVVLSACETGLGNVAGGEGLLGIQRGFQIAGARSTIASLWKVNDAATRRLMQEFYTNYLDKEMSILDALREAQLWAIKNPGEVPRGMKRYDEPEKPSRLPPQYWAPFVLSGDWR